ncbi:hypothetical protein MRB53_023424 [Persea americana]|uniref:Uncharacterized protein n=1 Tax=Persea americana TaxID=3435 RepID=A0ACC2L9D1_PERAE|nr:hypothetical protein MRB53_023424 [Persea americana]
MAQIPSIFSSSSLILLLLVLSSSSINVAQHPTFNLSPSYLQALQIKTYLTDLHLTDFLFIFSCSSLAHHRPNPNKSLFSSSSFISTCRNPNFSNLVRRNPPLKRSISATVMTSAAYKPEEARRDFCAPDPDPTSPALLHVSSLTLGTGLADSLGHGGSLSPAIANLTTLAQLVVHPGRISGPIPPQIGPNLAKICFKGFSLSRSYQQCSERQETQFKPISFRSEIVVDRTRWCICRPSDEKGKNSGENEMGFVGRALGFRT